MRATQIHTWTELVDRHPAGAFLEGVDLVVIRVEDQVSVFYGRCQHRGGMLADGSVQGDNLVCGLHGWHYDVHSGVSPYDGNVGVHRFNAWVDGDGVFVDADEVAAWEGEHPQPFDRDAYLGQYASTHDAPEETHVHDIQGLARADLSGGRADGTIAAMGVPLCDLPAWDSIQFVTAQLARRPLLDDDPVDTATVIGPRAKSPLTLAIPLFVSDMSFGALSAEAKIALATGAEGAHTAICSGEGGMLPEEHQACSRYLYELASGEFGWDLSKVADVQGFHFKFGQAAKTGTGGHLPGRKVEGRIAEVRHLEPGTASVSPATFVDLRTPADFRELAEAVREVSGGIPIGAKMSAQRIEDDIDAAIEIGVDYIILDGRGGGTGAAPLLFRDNISVPTIPALARARRHLDQNAPDVTLVITGGLRMPADFAKALALGADAIAVSNAAIQAIGCLGMRACQTNNCPVGIATQQPHLRARLDIEKSAALLTHFFESAVTLMSVLARACGHSRLGDFAVDDLTTFDREMHHLAGIPYGGLRP